MTLFCQGNLHYTLQGEGAQTGTGRDLPAFRCGLQSVEWAGARPHAAGGLRRFCDTDFVGTDGAGGGKFSNAAIAGRCSSRRMAGACPWQPPYVVCTGGEPLLQIDTALITALHAKNFEIAVETNGTLAAPPGLDWICVSPKADAEQKPKRGDELKLIYPQDRRRSGEVCAARVSIIFSCNRWTTPHPPSQHAGRPSPIAWPTRNGAYRYKPTNCWEFPGKSMDKARMVD